MIRIFCCIFASSNNERNKNMIIRFLVIYFIIALFSVAIIKISLEGEEDDEDVIYSDERNTVYSIIYGTFWPITIIILIIIFLYRNIEKLVRKIFYYFRNKKKNIDKV